MSVVQTPVTMRTPRTMSMAPPMMLRARICRFRNVTERRGPAESDGEQHERDAEAERVRDGQDGRAPRVCLRDRDREDRGHRRADAGRPAHAHRDAEERSADESEVLAHLWPEGALREPEHTDEDEAEQDHGDAEDAGDRILVLNESPAERTAEDEDGDEDDRESGDEEGDTQNQPAPLRGLRTTCPDGGASCTSRTSGRRPRGDGAPEKSEVAGHEWEDARREKRHETCHHGDRDRQPQGTIEDDRAGVHGVSATASVTRVLRTEALCSCPTIRAATRPSLSSTNVVGAACKEVDSANASFNAASLRASSDG